MRILAAVATTIAALSIAAAMAAAQRVPASEAVTMTTPPVEVRWMRGLLARESGFDAYWSVTNYAKQTYTVFRTGFDSDGVLQRTAVPLAGNCQASTFAGRGDLPLAVSDGQLCAVSGAQLRVLQDLPAPGLPTTIACGTSHCLAIWSSGIKLAQWLDASGNPLGSIFTVPPANRLYSLVVNDDGALMLRLSGGELRATFIDVAGKVRFDQQLARGLLSPPVATADDDGDRFVVAWVDFSIATSKRPAVQFITVAHDGSANAVALLEAATWESPFNNLALAWNGESHLFAIAEYGGSWPMLRLVQLDRGLNVNSRRELGTIRLSSPHVPIVAVSGGGRFALGWTLEAPMFATVSATGVVSQPVRMDPPPARRRASGR